MFDSDRPLRRAALSLFLLTPLVAEAQLDDPGLELSSPPVTPAPTPPTRTPTLAPTPTRTPLPPPPVITSAPPRVHEEKKEESSFTPDTQLSDDEWELRLAAPSLNGAVGLLHLQTAEVGQPLHFRVGSHLQGFSQDCFLIGPAAGQPCTSTDAMGRKITTETNARFLGDFILALTGPDVLVLRNLELYLTLSNSSNENARKDDNRTDPKVILSLGDLAMGIKGAGELARGFSLGGNFGVRFFNSISDVLANFSATNIDFNLLAMVDVRKFAPSVPLRFHWSSGFLIDRSLNLLPATQCASSTGNDACIRSRVVETFAYGIGTTRFRLGIGLEAPFRAHVPWGIFGIAPFLEYQLARAFGDGDKTVEGALTADRQACLAHGGTGCIAPDRIVNQNIQSLAIGVRLRPIARLVLDAALDFGLQSPGFQYGAPLPGWNFIFGAAYTYDPAGSGTKVVTRTITRTYELPLEGKVHGVVRDAKTRQGIAGAIVRYPGMMFSSQATGEDGSFTSYGLPPGTISVEVAREGYEAVSSTAQIEASADGRLEVLLKARPTAPDRKIRLKLTDDRGTLLRGGSVRFVGATTVEATAGSDGFSAQLAGGDYAVSVDVPGYLSREKQVTVAASGDQTFDLALHRRPATSHVVLGANAITLKGALHFANNGAALLADAHPLLDELVDLLAKNGDLRRISIEGHLDNKGGADRALKLSRDRAQAVVDYLVKQGVAASRLTAVGFGSQRPLVPNLTPANRAKNRRIEFKIVDRSSSFVR